MLMVSKVMEIALSQHVLMFVLVKNGFALSEVTVTGQELTLLSPDLNS